MKKLFAIVLALACMLTVSALAEDLPTIVMGTNAEFSPYEFHDGDEIVGIDADIAAAIAEKLGYQLVIEDMDFNSIVTSVATGKIDFGMAGLSITEERLQTVDFTISYATGYQVIIIPEGSPIASVDDLMAGGYTIGVQQATTGDLYCTWDIEDEGLGTVMRFNKGADAVAALVSGKLDCVVIDNEPAKVFVAANPGLAILETAYAIEDYAICVSKDNPELLDDMNAALTELIEDGTVKAIIDSYISAE